MKTDSQLQRDVSAELDSEPSVHAEHIGVAVKDGVVILAGRVDSYAEKCNAEHAAFRVAGVRAMTTKLKVNLTNLSQRTDSDIAASVGNVLDWTPLLRAGAIQATTLAWGTPGVRIVVDMMRLAK